MSLADRPPRCNPTTAWLVSSPTSYGSRRRGTAELALVTMLRADFDGDRLALAAGGCVWVGDVDEALAGPPGGLCPQAVTGEGRRRARRGGSRYAYTFPCLMAPARAVGESPATRSPSANAGRGGFGQLGELTTITFRVSRGRLRRLRNRAGTVWTFISVRSTDTFGRTSVSESVPLGVVP
jgi:hypothetical protein